MPKDLMSLDLTHYDLSDERWLVSGTRFPQPDWVAVAEHLESNSLVEFFPHVFDHLARQWIEALRQAFGPEFTTKESPRFVLVSAVPEAKARELLDFLERCYHDIRAVLPFVRDNEPEGRCPVLVLPDRILFYDYLDDYSLEESGEFGGAGGVYLNRGYGHFATLSTDLASYMSVFSHELSHAMVAHLRLPPWLDEAIAMGVEQRINPGMPYLLDQEMVRRHQEYWTEEKIQDFWRGKSFLYPDEGQELSYHLAQFLLKALDQGGQTPAELMSEYVQNASGPDAGVSAARDILGLDLTDVLTSFLGPGDWEPQPDAEQTSGPEAPD